MSRARFKTFCFTLEALNGFAVGLYFNWLFFFTKSQLQFEPIHNLSLVAVHGLIYAGAAWFGGWFCHRHGSYRALKLGFTLMAVTLGLGAVLPTATAQVAVMMLWTFGMCFTWPTLQSLISLGESSRRLQRLAGIYNIIWAGLAAVSFFLGGAILESLGYRASFWLPAVVHVAQLLFVFWMEKQPQPSAGTAASAPPTPLETATLITPMRQRLFLKLALLANPFAYVAINTAIPLIPEVAQRFQLSPKWAGFFCSVWFFSRLGAFALFWLWPAWHYRFAALFVANGALILSFVALLLAPALWMIFIAQIFFGISVGLIYYSSLFYSMDGGAARSEHGGAHEAAIGGGTFLGASAGVVAYYFAPHDPTSGVWAITALLLCGFAGLIYLRFRKPRQLLQPAPIPSPEEGNPT